MDKENNNTEIDFASQPLALMAEEGKEIEEQVALESAKKKEAEVQANPFEDVNSSVSSALADELTQPIKILGDNVGVNGPSEEVKEEKEENKEEVTEETENTLELTPKESSEEDQELEEYLKASRAVNSSNNDLADEITKDLNLETATSDMLPDIMAAKEMEKAKAKLDNASDENPGYWGIIAFVIMCLVVAGAWVFFKSDKFGSMMIDEEAEERETAKGKDEESEAVTGPNYGEITSYHLKQTFYINDGTTAIIGNSVGDVDLINNVMMYKFDMSLNSMISRTYTVYVDLNTGTQYLENKTGDGTEWIIEYGEPGYHHKTPIELLKKYMEKPTLQEIDKEHYKFAIEKDEIIAALEEDKESSEYAKLVIGDGEATFNLVDGRLNVIKIDVTNMVEGYKGLTIRSEYTDYNKQIELHIPEEALNS